MEYWPAERILTVLLPLENVKLKALGTEKVGCDGLDSAKQEIGSQAAYRQPAVGQHRRCASLLPRHRRKDAALVGLH